MFLFGFGVNMNLLHIILKKWFGSIHNGSGFIDRRKSCSSSIVMNDPPGVVLYGLVVGGRENLHGKGTTSSTTNTRRDLAL